MLRSLAVAISMLLPTPILAQEQIPGVNGNLILIEKNPDTANEAIKIKAAIGDKIEINWHFAVSPGSIPTAASAKSDSASVRFEEIRSISRPKVIGAGTIGAFFIADRQGSARLTFAVKSGVEAGVILQCDVEVLPAGALKVKSSVGPEEVDRKKVLPEKSKPTAPLAYEGRVRNILARELTFGFSVRNEALPGESGFYVANNEANKTLIETILFAAGSGRAIRVYYDDKTMVAEAIESWSW